MKYLQTRKVSSPSLKGLEFSRESIYSDTASAESESLLNDDSQPMPFQRRGSSTKSKIVMTVLFLLVSLACFSLDRLYSTGGHAYCVSDTLFPRRQYEQRVFHETGIVPSIEADRVWTEGMAHEHGFVIVEQAADYDIPPGVAYADGHSKYGFSWAHQYHCLWMLRGAFWDLVNNKSNLVGIDANESSVEGAELWHLAHCFDYLRQNVLCTMDMTLEYPTGDGVRPGHIDGYEIAHQCVRREPLDAYVDAHAPNPELAVKSNPTPLPTHEELIHGEAGGNSDWQR